MSQTKVTRGMALRKRRSGVIREVAGFTTKPSSNSPSDGIRRARLVGPSGAETRIKVEQITKTYEPVAA